ncbi:AAA family ATPase [Hydrogenophaga sp.]|uniref:AAA family ATPase n=1 Tax=Hydrogenophaga sp. TaxID=1904254 RepID=UPI0025BF922D|nr:AAA family ATPase [Hydrogenophaga sp.]MBT9467204.1 AAA family ATPase [Hydrogenophaga sp.]
MTAVSTITPHLATLECPAVLRALPGWLVWRYEQVAGEEKPRKVPYYTAGGKRHGVQGRPEDRQQLTSFDAARSAAIRRGLDGVGFCPMPEWGVVALDFDGALLDGGLHPDVERLVAGTYAEWSPSGQGVRAFMRGEIGNRKDHRRIPFGFETFSSKGFVTFTGNALPITELTDSTNTVADITPDVLELCTVRFGRATPDADLGGPTAVEPLGLTPEQLREALDVLDPSMGHDPWLKVGMALHHETSGEGFELWDEWSSRGHQYPGRDALMPRWDSFGRGGQRPTTAHLLVRMANDQGAHIDIAQLESADDFDVITPTTPAQPTSDKPSRFKVVPAGEFASGKPPTWLVKDVLPAADLMLLIGESQAGKSFVALDLAAAVARGVEWRGKRVRQGRVVYIAAEGAAGVRNRLKAYASVNDLDLLTLNIGVIPAAPNLLMREDALEVCREIIAAGGADLVIIDTFAQVTPGANENAAEDMGKALANCRGFNVALRCPVLLVHHMGKDASRGARGWSGLKAAADAELEVLRMPTGRMLRVSKQKDGEDGLSWGFDLDQVPVGQDEDGEVITSCVVREAALPAVQQVREFGRRMGKWEAFVVAAINEIAQSQTAGIELSAVIDAAVALGPKPEEGKRDTRKQHAKRALQALCDEPDSPYFVEDGCLSLG